MVSRNLVEQSILSEIGFLDPRHLARTFEHLDNDDTDLRLALDPPVLTYRDNCGVHHRTPTISSRIIS
jgi:hypothetical protein